MTVYLASPKTQQQAHSANGMPVLLSFALWSPWMVNYAPSFPDVLIDSGAFSAHNSGADIDVAAFADWSEQWRGIASAVACLDSIAGDWREGWRNMEAMPQGLGFPTFHDSDPDGLLPDLCEAAKERGGWLGIGMQPEARHSRGTWLRETLERIPDGLHVHGWAGRRFWQTHRRLDSVDSTNWLLDVRKVLGPCPWLTAAEATDIIVKRYQRERRILRAPSESPGLFDAEGGAA